MIPALAYDNAASAIAGIGMGLGIAASMLHVCPDGIFGHVEATMFDALVASFRCSLQLKASTAKSMSGPEMRAGHNRLSSAITSTEPKWVPMAVASGPGHHNQTAETSVYERD